MGSEGGGGGGSLILLVLMVVAFWLLLLRPQRARAKAMREIRSSLAPGQEVMTTAGLIATVASVEDDVVVLELSPGVTARFAAGAVVRVLTPRETPSEDLGDSSA